MFRRNWANLVLGCPGCLADQPSGCRFLSCPSFALIGLEQEALSISETAVIHCKYWAGPVDAVRAMDKYLVEDPTTEARLNFGRLLASAGDYDRARPLAGGVLAMAWGTSYAERPLNFDAAALIAIRREAGEETGVDEILAAIKDNVRRYRETGYTNGPCLR